MRLYSSLLRKLVVPIGDRLFHQAIGERLRLLETAQWWPRERLHQRRDECLSEVIRLAYHEVPFYRELYDLAGVCWSDIRRAEDLHKLPVITKAMIRPAYPDRITRKTNFPTHVESSSGSTGAPFYVLEDSETASIRRSSFLLALGWAGWSLGDSHLQTGVIVTRDIERRLKDFFLRCHYASALDLSDSQLDETLARMDRRKIRHLWGYPCSLYLLAGRAAELGWNQKLDSIVTWGDNLYSQYRNRLQSVFQAQVYDTYGCSEGMQIAAQCGLAPHYHIHTLDTIVELLDDEGNPVRPGESGHVILTRLHAGATPLVRYAVGDMAVNAGDRICSCRRGFDLLESIQGRDSDYVFTPSNSRYIAHFFEGVIEEFPQVQQFQVVQREPDSILIRLVVKGSTSGLTAQVVAAFRHAGVVDLRIDVEPVPFIPATPTGKRRYVINELLASAPAA